MWHGQQWSLRRFPQQIHRDVGAQWVVNGDDDDNDRVGAFVKSGGGLSDGGGIFMGRNGFTGGPIPMAIQHGGCYQPACAHDGRVPHPTVQRLLMGLDVIGHRRASFYAHLVRPDASKAFSFTAPA
ncbi:unnamed protein product [Soboliphyme baturini]|uniref:PGRP domain-containing protein n=1 Tax=Soboliphyme baturini TaxID=241478 RepID=A0A183IRL6_9BILA|nr:unnamed protein product [Soboliphyme baturini]